MFPREDAREWSTGSGRIYARMEYGSSSLTKSPRFYPEMQRSLPRATGSASGCGVEGVTRASGWVLIR